MRGCNSRLTSCVALEGAMRRAVLAGPIALVAFIATARANKFPSHPITIVVPFSAGGPSDAMTRILAERMQRTLGETILIENVTGAGGSLGVGRAQPLTATPSALVISAPTSPTARSTSSATTS